MKICTKCKVEKDEDLFSKNRSKKYGLNSCCKKCEKEYKEKNKQKIKESWAKYRESNKDKLRESSLKYSENNKEKIKESNAKSKAKNRERMKEYWVKYHARNKYKEQAYYKDRRKNLVDRYVISLIRKKSSLKVKDIPKSLIEAKRMQILINRTLKEIR